MVKNITLSWNFPTTRVDASALPASEIDSVKIYSDQGNTAANAPFFLVTTRPYASGNTMVQSSVSSGTYRYKISTLDIEGQESPISNVITAVVPSLPALPNPPSGFGAVVS